MAGQHWARVVAELDKRPLILTGLAVVVGLAAAYSLSPRRYELREGVVAPRNVYSPRDDTWLDEEATEEARRQAVQGVAKIYAGRRPEAYQEMLARLTTIFASAEITAEELRRSHEEQMSDRADRGEGEEGDGTRAEDKVIRSGWETLDPTARPPLEAYAFVVRLRPADRAAFRDACQRALNRINEEREIRDDELEAALAQAKDRLEYWGDVRALGVPNVPGVRDALAGVCLACIVPNATYDHAATEAERARVAASVKPIMRSVKRGELIVAQGTVVGADDLRRLRALGLVADESTDWRVRLLSMGMALFALILTLLLIYHFEPDSVLKTRRLAALALLVAVPAVAYNVMLNEENLPYTGYALTQFAVLAATALLGPFSAACLLGMLVACFMLVAGPANLHGVWAVMAGGAAGMVAFRYLTYRPTQVALLGLASSAFAFVTIGFVELYLERRGGIDGGGVYITGAAIEGRWALAAGLAGVFGGYYASRCLEYSLETVTEMRLLELSDPRHPLLNKLLHEAPGTYHSSLLVSNIAGAAAEAIGRSHDALLVRVGALYHDIGKIDRAHMFVENQGVTNPHDTLDPGMSAKTIIGHVRRGVELAQEYRLPRPIVDCIMEHHGTTLVRFFYDRALEMGRYPINESDYRYPGPKPRSVATGILMLADTVEASVRSLPDPTPDAIRAQVRKVIEGKLGDGQLDECPLTMREIKIVEQSLVDSMLGIYHVRIEYPDPDEKGKGTQGNHAPAAGGPAHAEGAPSPAGGEDPPP